MPIARCSDLRPWVACVYAVMQKSLMACQCKFQRLWAILYGYCSGLSSAKSRIRRDGAITQPASGSIYKYSTTRAQMPGS
jgi:hypothetical protein